MTAAKHPAGRPTTDTLTDRYVWAVLRSLPEAQRSDIDRELRASIADDVDARVEAGEERAAAERAVLLDLGDPMRLSAGYAGRPLSLIGPDLYIDYVRLLKLLLWIVIPIVAVTMFVINAVSGATIGGVIGGTIGVTLSVGVHLCFWTTVIFVIVERTGAAPAGATGRKDSWVPFDPDALTAVPTDNGASRSQLVASLVFLVFVPVALVWQQVSSAFHDASGAPIPLLDPELWSFWVPYFFVLAALAAVLAIVLYRAGRWTPLLVGLNAVIAIATAAPLAWLIWTGQVVNPALLEHLGWHDVAAQGSVTAIANAVAVGAVAVWAIGDSVWKCVRSDRLASRS